VFLPTGYYVTKKADTDCLISGLDFGNLSLFGSSPFFEMAKHNKLIIRHFLYSVFFKPPQITVVEYANLPKLQLWNMYMSPTVTKD
jgi:hypothetical protein